MITTAAGKVAGSAARIVLNAWIPPTDPAMTISHGGGEPAASLEREESDMRHLVSLHERACHMPARRGCPFGDSLPDGQVNAAWPSRDKVEVPSPLALLELIGGRSPDQPRKNSRFVMPHLDQDGSVGWMPA